MDEDPNPGAAGASPIPTTSTPAAPPLRSLVDSEQYDALHEQLRAAYGDADPNTGLRALRVQQVDTRARAAKNVDADLSKQLRTALADKAAQTFGVLPQFRDEAAAWLLQRTRVVDSEDGPKAVLLGDGDWPAPGPQSWMAQTAGTDKALPERFLPPMAPPEPTAEEAALADSRPLEAAPPRNVTITESQARDDFAAYERAHREARAAGGEVLIVPDEPKPATRDWRPGIDVPITYADSRDFNAYEAAQALATRQGGEVVVTTTEADHSAEELDAAENAGRRGFHLHGNTMFGAYGR